jgi:cytochrome P450
VYLGRVTQRRESSQASYLLADLETWVTRPKTLGEPPNHIHRASQVLPRRSQYPSRRWNELRLQHPSGRSRLLADVLARPRCFGEPPSYFVAGPGYPALMIADTPSPSHALLAADRPIPTATSRGPLGHLLRFRRAPIPTLFECWRECGDLTRVRLGAVSPHLVIHPDGVQHVLQSNAKNYDKQTRGFSKLKLALGEGLLTSEGALWRKQRRAVQPAFHKERLEGFAAVMTDATATMLDGWGRRTEPLDVADEMTGLTLDIIARTMFSAELGPDSKSLASMVTLSARHINSRITSLTGMFDFWEKLPTPANRRFWAARREGDALIHRVIERRRSGKTEPTSDLLSMLMESRDQETGEGMSDQQLRDEVVTIFSAGHETTAQALTWTFYLLSTHPEAERRLRDEVRAALGDTPPTLADLPRLGYAGRVIKESMRLFPPAWAISRRAETDDHLGAHRIPARTFVLLVPYLTHRHPAFWENPEGFDPDRFLPERSKGQHRFAYVPFGAGARMCIGSNFALMEAQLVLASVVQRYRLDLLPGHPVELDALITLRSRHGMRMKAVPAHSPTA